MALYSTRQHFLLIFSFFRLSFHGNGISSKFQKPVFIHTMSTSENSSFSISVFSWVRTVRPKLGVFPKFMKFNILFCFITQLIKRLQQWSLNEVIEDIRPFVLNTKRPLSDIWLLRYKQNRFGCFRKNSEFQFSQKTPKIVLLISQQPNIAQRPFCIQNERQDILYHLL